MLCGRGVHVLIYFVSMYLCVGVFAYVECLLWCEICDMVRGEIGCCAGRMWPSMISLVGGCLLGFFAAEVQKHEV